MKKQLAYNQIAGQKLGRIEALSDGFFSIAMTLLVLDLKLPVSEALHAEADLLRQLAALGPKLLTYLVSFMTLGIFWMGQSAQFSNMHRTDRRLTWLSLLYLLFVSLVPFTTSFLGEHIHFKIAIAVYWLNIFCLGASLYLHWWCAYENDYISVGQGVDKTVLDKAMRRRIVIAQLLYLCGALLCFISTYLSIAFILAVQLNYAFAFFAGKNKLPPVATVPGAGAGEA